MKQQRGFTLIELMIALALGLVVVAAATLLFLTGVRSQAMQQGVSDLQDNANFGLNYITQDIRLANLDANKAALSDQLEQGGVVLATSNLPSGLSGTVASLLSFSGTGVSNVNEGSDQLVIQFKPAQMGTYDCEGGLIDDPNEIIIQRYFLRVDTNASPTEGSPLALACDAGRYDENGATRISDYSNSSEIIMKRVDQFHVLLSVINTVNNERRYISIDEYMGLAGTKPRIVGIVLGVLTRSSQAVGTDAAIAQNNAFTLLDQDLVVQEAENPEGYIRRVVTQEVALRNALGDRE